MRQRRKGGDSKYFKLNENENMWNDDLNVVVKVQFDNIQESLQKVPSIGPTTLLGPFILIKVKLCVYEDILYSVNIQSCKPKYVVMYPPLYCVS